MPDPNQLVAGQQPEMAVKVDQQIETQTQQTGAALDPEMKIKKNYARKADNQVANESGQV